MGYLFGGLLLAGLLLFLLEWWARAETAAARRTLMTVVLALAGLVGLLFIARGQWLVGAVPLLYSLSRLFNLAQRVLWVRRLVFGMGRPGEQSAGNAGGRARPDTLSRTEAFDILGLEEGASRAQIQTAYRRLMEQVHPDRGGSHWLAERLNAARDRLLKK